VVEGDLTADNPATPSNLKDRPEA